MKEFFLKSRRLQTKNKNFIKGSFPWNLLNFAEQLLSRTTFGECFIFGAHQNSNYLVDQTNKHPLEVVRPTIFSQK